MMLFKFKKKKIVIDAFTHDTVTFKAFKAKKSIEFIPDWFKNLRKVSLMEFAKDRKAFPTMKSCPGLTGLFTKGFIIPMWSDVFIKMTAYDRASKSGEFSYQFSDNESRITFHYPHQFEGFLTPYGQQHIKFETPWVFQTASKVDFLITGCPWNYPKGMPFNVLPGTVDLVLNDVCQINAYMTYEDNPREVLIPCGSPLAQVIPLSEDDIELQTHLVSMEEFTRLRTKSPSSCSFANGYRKALKRID